MPLILRSRADARKRQMKSPKRREKPRPEWNSYLTDDDRFKLPKEKVLERKSLFVSKHNIMHSIDVSPVKQAQRRVRLSKKPKSQAKQSIDLLSNISDSDCESEESILQPDERHEKDSVKVHATPSKSLKSLPARHAHDFRVTHVNTTAKHPEATPKKVVQTPHRVRTSIPSRKAVLPSHSSPAALTPLDASELRDMIANLHQELHYYRQLSGKASAIADPEELELLMDGEDLSVPILMKFLTTLVCQTMSHLLQSELALQQQNSNYQELSQRLDKLTESMALSTSIAKPTPSYQTPIAPAPISTNADRTHDLYSDRAREEMPAPVSRELDPDSAVTPIQIKHASNPAVGTATSDWLLSASRAEASPPITVTKRLYGSPQHEEPPSSKATPPNQRLAALQRQIALLRHQKYDAQHGSGDILRQMLRSTVSPVPSDSEQPTPHRVYLDVSQADREVWFGDTPQCNEKNYEGRDEDEDRLHYDSISSTLFSTPVPPATTARSASPTVHIPSTVRMSGEYESTTIYMPELPTPQLAPVHPYGSGGIASFSAVR